MGQSEYEYFKHEINITCELFREVKRHFVSLKEKILTIFMTYIIFVCATILLELEEYAFVSFILSLIIGVIIVNVLQPKRILKSIYNRNLETLGTKELSQAITFMEERIKVFSLDSGGTIHINYEAIVRVVETKSTYTLFSKTEIIIFICKQALEEDYKNEEFIRFLKEKCKNIRIKLIKQRPT